MSLGLCFWIVMLVALVFGAIPLFKDGNNWRAAAPSFLYWFLFLLLGWQVFGAPLHG